MSLRLILRSIFLGSLLWTFSSSALADEQKIRDLIKQKFPKFLIGIYRWDNAMLSTLLLTRGVKVYDASDSILAMHQGIASHNHKREVGSKYNDALAHAFIGKSYIQGNTENIKVHIMNSSSGLVILED